MRKELGLAILILVIGCVVALLQPRFISTVNLVNMANLVGLYGLFSIGQGLVIITAGIELSVGSMFALIGVVFVDMVVNWGWSWPLALAAAIGMGGVFGAIHGFLVARVGIQPFVVTLCALLIYRGAARYYTDDATVGFGYGGDFDTLANFATGRSFGVPNSFLAMVVVGGCSLRGGEGSILGIILGTVLLQVLQNLVNLLGIPSSLNFAVMGTVILIGVLADQHLQKMRTARLARAVPVAAERAPAVAGTSPKP
jgi:ribose/xylose/arabinose/galactoside ABC-type transport system permease subunit